MPLSSAPPIGTSVPFIVAICLFCTFYKITNGLPFAYLYIIENLIPVMPAPIAIAIHAGAGTILRKRITPAVQQQYEQELRQALEAGVHLLQQGGSSLDAVTAAVMVLEDCPLFNAGRGSVFNSKGHHEMDAAIMDGHTLKAGAVTGIQRIKNPIQVARLVMEKSHFVFLAREGANEFARKHQLSEAPDNYFYTEYRYKDWQRKQQNT